MLDYFSNNSATMKGRVLDPSFISIRRTIINYLPKVRQRVFSSSRFVPPTHILIKALSGLGLTEDMDGNSLRSHVMKRGRKMAPALNITSASSYGALHTGQFLQNGNEVIMFTYDRFECKSWHKLSPVKFMYHTNTNVNFQVGTDDDSGSFAYITVNLYMLAHQFLQWRAWKISRGNDDSLATFIARFAIYNAVESYMDISMFNRHYYRVIGTAFPSEPKWKEFPVPSIEAQIDRSNIKVITSIMSRGTSAAQTLYNTPALFVDSAYELTKLPSVVMTNQSEWFMYATILPYIHYGLAVSYTTGDSVNQSDMSKLAYELRAFINSRTLSHVPKHTKGHIIDTYLEPLLELTDGLRS